MELQDNAVAWPLSCDCTMYNGPGKWCPIETNYAKVWKKNIKTFALYRNLSMSTFFSGFVLNQCVQIACDCIFQFRAHHIVHKQCTILHLTSSSTIFSVQSKYKIIDFSLGLSQYKSIDTHSNNDEDNWSLASYDERKWFCTKVALVYWLTNMVVICKKNEYILSNTSKWNILFIR